MSISEKDAVLRERAAFERAVEWTRACLYPWGNEWIAERDRRYPLPTQSRQRTDPDHPEARWLVAAGMLCVQCHSNIPERYPREREGMYPTPARVAIWADLLANPTEEVES